MTFNHTEYYCTLIFQFFYANKGWKIIIWNKNLLSSNRNSNWLMTVQYFSKNISHLTAFSFFFFKVFLILYTIFHTEVVWFFDLSPYISIELHFKWYFHWNWHRIRLSQKLTRHTESEKNYSICAYCRKNDNRQMEKMAKNLAGKWQSISL